MHKKDNHYAKQVFARNGFCLDEFTYDPDYRVRMAVAEQRHNLNILMNDTDWHVRKAVAEQGYGLNVLINDTNKFVRLAAQEKLKSRRP